MLKFIFLTLFCFSINFVLAQDIAYVEYFIDIDPGKGFGQSINIPEAGDDLTFDFPVNTTDLKGGFHTLYIRARDATGSWSMLHAKAFYIFEEITLPPNSSISYVEYFFDLDPGKGLATPLVVGSPGEDINLSFGPDISGLLPGFHTLYIRARDDQGQWTLNKAYAFYIPFEIVPQSSDVSRAQYYFAAVDFTSQDYSIPEFLPDTSITSGFTPDLTELMTDSAYAIRIYAIDSKGRRSLDYVHEFIFMPDLAFSLYSLNFDSVGVGDSSSFSIPVYAYEDNINITEVTMSGGNDYSVSTTTLPWILNTNDSIIVNLKFKPQTTGVLKDTVLIYNSSSNNPVRLFVSGYGKTITAITDAENLIPKTLVLRQNYPNPFNPSTTIKYDLPKVMDVEIEVFNMLGQHIKTLLKQQQQAGMYSVKWDGLNEQGITVPSGVYLYKLKAGKTIKTFKMILLK